MRYRVTIEEWTSYRVEVEAKDRTEAEYKGLDVLFENDAVDIGDCDFNVVDVRAV
jgi:hypothetical protein